MTFDVKFDMDPMTLTAEMGEVYDVGTERLELAREEGHADGYAAGETVGYETGFSAGSGAADAILDRTIERYTSSQLRYVGQYAFSGCSNLKTVDLHVASGISTYAFQGCSNLSVLILRNPDGVCTLRDTNAFYASGISKKTCLIFVPNKLLSKYKSATNWAGFSALMRAIENYPGITGG